MDAEIEQRMWFFGARSKVGTVTLTQWNEEICDGGVKATAGRVELRDLARGLSGGLFVALPLLFTAEMWEIARSISNVALLTFFAISFLMIRYYVDFAGFREIDGFGQAPWWDAIVACGIGITASAITLFATGILKVDLPLLLIVKTVTLEAIPTSIGVAVAINQLGPSDGAKHEPAGLSKDGVVIIGTILGAVLFAFNLAPTLETKIITSEQDWNYIALTFALSVALSYMVVAVACFETRDLSDRKYITSEWLEALVSYLISFCVSVLFLWAFGYATPLDPLNLWLPQTIVLSYATTLGGAAGRIIL